MTDVEKIELAFRRAAALFDEARIALQTGANSLVDLKAEGERAQARQEERERQGES